jgi:hypothetical protein
MSNRFISFLDKVGHVFKKGLDVILPVAETAGEVGVRIFAPEVYPLFHQTVAAVVTAEQNAAAVGAEHTGAQKLAAVVQIMGGLIKQGLVDAGKEASDAKVQEYISAVVTILRAFPVPLEVDAPIVGTLTRTVAALPTSEAPHSTTAAPAQPQPAMSAIQSVLP